MLRLSAKYEPEMPQTQYFLGRALIQKGDRPAAETALRRAIQLKPNWGEPHYLLAVIYGTEQPIYVELARFHYKKAIAGGATRNLDLEKRIDGGAATPKP
jgi:Flp pilus assembly protein TadD